MQREFIEFIKNVPECRQKLTNRKRARALRAQQELKVFKKCDNLQRLCFLPDASKRTEHNGMRIPYVERIQPIGKKKALPYVLEQSDRFKRGTVFLPITNR